MLLFIALLTFFAVTGLKDFGVQFKYWDLIRGVACFLVVISLILGQGSVL